MNIRSAWLLNSTPDGNGGQSRIDTRLAPLGTMTPSGPLMSRDGVIPGSPNGDETVSGLQVTGGATGMSAKVSPGRAVVQSTEVAGAYPVYVPEYTSITFADGDPGNPRVDLVVVRIYDNDQDASNKTAAAIEIVQGTPSASPTAPPTPSGSLALAEVTVPAGASTGAGGLNWKSAVKDRRRVTVAVGGIIPRGWGLGFNGAYPGQYRDTGVGLERWDGSVWKPYPDPIPSWQSYTPKWGAENGPQPKTGNGSVTGRYIKVGNEVRFYASLSIGTTSNWGGSGHNGNWYLTLPVPPAVPIAAHFRGRIGPGDGVYYFGGCQIYRSDPNNRISGVADGTGVARGWCCNDSNGRPSGAWVDADHPAVPTPDKSWYEVWGTYEVNA